MAAALVDYLSRITLEHDTAPKYMAMLSIYAQWAVDRRTLLAAVPGLYDIDVAVGQQLDVDGQWIGFSRYLPVPIEGVYFSFNIAGVGFNEGVWKGPFDPSEGLTRLDDATYRLMLYLLISANHWNGTFEQAQQLLRDFIQQSPGTLLFLQDNFDMTMTIAIAGVIPSTLFVALLASGYSRLRPAAVGSNVVVTSVSGTPLFGFNTENEYIAGFNHGAWGLSGIITASGVQWSSSLQNPVPFTNEAGQQVSWS